MWVTIYSDASYNQRTKLSTYAYYIKSNQGLMKSHGSCPPYVNTISEAEMYAAILAIGRAVKCLSGISVLCVNSDCTYVTKKLMHQTPNVKNIKVKDLVYRAKHYVLNNNIELKTRHVKAHTGGKDIRSWCNEVCDKGAKKAMGKALKGHRKENERK